MGTGRVFSLGTNLGESIASIYQDYLCISVSLYHFYYYFSLLPSQSQPYLIIIPIHPLQASSYSKYIGLAKAIHEIIFLLKWNDPYSMYRVLSSKVDHKQGSSQKYLGYIFVRIVLSYDDC